MTNDHAIKEAFAKAGASIDSFAQALRRSSDAVRSMEMPLLFLGDFVPHPHRHMAAMSARRQGKSIVLEQMRKLHAAELRPQRQQYIVSHDEFCRPRLLDLNIIERDRTHFERGGRYRKPPQGKLAVAPKPGMVQVRDRSGELVWRQIGAGKKAPPR